MSRKDEPTELPGDLPPDNRSFAERLDFLQLDEQDASRLRGMLEEFRDSADQFVAAFYEHLGAFDTTAGFLQDERRLRRLQQLQREHFESLLEAVWDEDYLRRRRRVGTAHAEVGLPPQWFLGAYGQYIQYCFRHCAGDPTELPPEYVERMVSLIKVVLLDIGLTLDSYFEQSTIKLRRALEMYWKSTLDLRQFAQLTSHDLKTPLATVANLCEEALDEFGDQMPAEARELIAKARQRTFQTSTMIDELLESTLNQGSADAQEEFLVQDVLIDVADRLSTAIRASNVELRLPKDAPAVWGNRVRLREAFYNVLANAVKYNEHATPRVQIDWRRDGGQVVFNIVDNGPGIPSQESERVFAPFRRLSQHRDTPGSGLGLYFAKQLVEESGGHIWLTSELHVGTTFHIALPTKRNRTSGG